MSGPCGVELLTNRTGAADRRRIAEGLRAGAVDIVVGTHALIYEGVEFSRLGLVVIDEQHRFGVEQRDLLRGKGDEPDVLVMTATPIPRTAAMLIYGDLDKSELRELPAGRTPIVTEVVGTGPLERQGVYDRVRAEVAQGRQVYVVCPLVEGSTKLEAQGGHRGVRAARDRGPRGSAARSAARPDAVDRQGGGHAGVPRPRARRTRGDDGDRGRGGRPERDGDGRRGRRPVRSLAAPPAARAASVVAGTRRGASCSPTRRPPTASARLEAMVESTDGFELAERDLEIRGAGEVFGERQSGWTDLKLGRLPA